MIHLGELTSAQVIAAAKHDGLGLRFGPFNARLRTSLKHLVFQLHRLYPSLPLAGHDTVFHYDLKVDRVGGARGRLRPLVQFWMDEFPPLERYPESHALPMFEWGLNWCVAMTGHRYLMLHAAVLERHGHAIILPAFPGSGKSTLCAALASRGWRMLTDEIGLLRPSDGRVIPLPRAIPLKNDAVMVIKAFASGAVFGPSFPNTSKGTIVHMAPPGDALAKQHRTALPRWIVFPRYRKDAAFGLKPEAKSVAFTRLAHNSFNYDILGATSFQALGKLVQQCDCFDSTHSDLETACAALTELADAAAFDDIPGHRAAS